MTRATSSPRSSVRSVCTTLVVRATCNGTLVAVTPTVADRPEKARLGLDGGSARSGGQVGDRADRADRVGERHQRAAVQNAAGGAAILGPAMVALTCCGVTASYSPRSRLQVESEAKFTLDAMSPPV